MLWILLLACNEPSVGADARALGQTLARAADQPDQAHVICGALHDLFLRADCVTATVERVAEQDPKAAGRLCEEIPASLGRDECFFVVAEQSGASTWCDAAGRFALDCRMHLWTQVVVHEVPGNARPGDVEARLRPLVQAAGFGPDEPHPWIPVYRRILGSRRPFDRPACHSAGTPFLVETCLNAGLQLYADLLNHARDTGTFPCDGSALPASVAYTADPELDALVAQRRPIDLCPDASP